MILGPGGIGKSSLAARAVEQSEEYFHAADDRINYLTEPFHRWGYIDLVRGLNEETEESATGVVKAESGFSADKRWNSVHSQTKAKFYATVKSFDLKGLYQKKHFIMPVGGK